MITPQGPKIACHRFVARNECKYNVGTDVVSCAFKQISFGMHSYNAKRC